MGLVAGIKAGGGQLGLCGLRNGTSPDGSVRKVEEPWQRRILEALGKLILIEAHEAISMLIRERQQR